MEAKKNHNCNAGEWGELPTHEYIEKQEIQYGGFGSAIDSCFEMDDYLWVSNGEHSNTVNFCPFCGYKSKNPVFKKLD